jgi:hypothetical protein
MSTTALLSVLPRHSQFGTELDRGQTEPYHHGMRDSHLVGVHSVGSQPEADIAKCAAPTTLEINLLRGLVERMGINRDLLPI